MRLHWSTRIAMLVVLMAMLSWQTRHTWTFFNPQYGWPMSFNNVSGQGYREWRPLALLVDAVVWTALAASAGVVVERWRRRPNATGYSIAHLFGIQAAVAILLSLGMGEHWLRANPNNGYLFPKYARVQFADQEFWLDIGLFSDPLDQWPVVRIVVVAAIGCAIYAVGVIVWNASRRILRFERHQQPGDQLNIERTTATMAKDPWPARVVYWVLVVVVLVMLMSSLFPPMVR